jgi:hypothetical protein
VNTSPIRTVLQSVATHLLSGNDGLPWQLESFVLREGTGEKPYLTAEVMVMGNYVNLCVRRWGIDQVRLALRVTHGPCLATAPDGRRAPPERQREPNVVTSAVLLTLSEASTLATSNNWRDTLTGLFTQAHENLTALAADIDMFVTARQTGEAQQSDEPQQS